jgi:hypothetical protein
VWTEEIWTIPWYCSLRDPFWQYTFRTYRTGSYLVLFGFCWRAACDSFLRVRSTSFSLFLHGLLYRYTTQLVLLLVYEILFGNIRSVPTVLEATWSLLDFVGERCL